MITFEIISEENLYIVKEMIRSNPDYNMLENGKTDRTEDEIRVEVFRDETESYLIKADETYIGCLDFMPENKKDGKPWLGLLMIHGDYQGYGYGTSAYYEFEQLLIERKVSNLRLAILNQNGRAIRFWEGNGFIAYGTAEHTGKDITCYEKQLIPDSEGNE